MAFPIWKVRVCRPTPTSWTLRDGGRRGVPLKYQTRGNLLLSEEDKERWEELDWQEDEEGGTPDEVKAGAVNRWVQRGYGGQGFAVRDGRMGEDGHGGPAG